MIDSSYPVHFQKIKLTTTIINRVTDAGYADGRMYQINQVSWTYKKHSLPRQASMILEGHHLFKYEQIGELVMEHYRVLKMSLLFRTYE